MSLLPPSLTGHAPGDPAAARRKAIVSIVSVLIIIGSICFLLRPRTRPGLMPYRGVGHAVAEQTAQALNNHGRVLVLYFAGNLHQNTMRQAFQDRLPRGIDVVATEAITLDQRALIIAVTREQFEAALQKHPSVDAVISFAGLPPYDPQNPLNLPKPSPKIIAFLDSRFPVKQEFIEGNVVAVVSPRSGVDLSSPSPKTPRELFEKYFVIYDATNYQSLRD